MAGEDTQEWVHATNACNYHLGDVLGWRDERSETGMLSGIVVRPDALHLRVLVRDIRAAVVAHPPRPRKAAVKKR